MSLAEDLLAVRTDRIKIHGPEGFAGMRKAGRLAAECLDMLTPYVQPGVTTAELDRLAREFALDNGALPACIFYRGYSHTVCISPNHVVCHGIPDPDRRRLARRSFAHVSAGRSRPTRAPAGRGDL